MALTEFQRRICKLIAQDRIDSGSSYIAGGTALNTLLSSSRISRDIDIFHDSAEAVQAAWEADQALLDKNGYAIAIQRERSTYIEAVVSRDGNEILIEWTQDSAFRFFPLVVHEDLGLTLHPFDAATNKVLALAGRLEARDWIDTITCHNELQKLGYLIWAACGKDPGFSPASLLMEARRSSHYSQLEINTLAFEGPPPDASELNSNWHDMLSESDAIIKLLPPEHAGCCVLTDSGDLYNKSADELEKGIISKDILYHQGAIHGAFPRIKP